MGVDLVEMTDRWVRKLATSPLPVTRRQLVRIAVGSIEPYRRDWLELLARDCDPVVSQAALSGLSTLEAEEIDFARVIELDERFSTGVVPRELSWEWEYSLSLWLPGSAPRTRLCFLAQRDDSQARLAAWACGWETGAECLGKGGIFIRSCRLVCEYTRSPRSIGEASAWKKHGRPRPPEE
ncbi:MAG: hypothetical protein HY876_10180 [Coriobacteriales bacterium]|nr:hypothetical protein [Coriobacteriales bacterium]